MLYTPEQKQSHLYRGAAQRNACGMYCARAPGGGRSGDSPDSTPTAIATLRPEIKMYFVFTPTNVVFINLTLYPLFQRAAQGERHT